MYFAQPEPEYVLKQGADSTLRNDLEKTFEECMNLAYQKYEPPDLQTWRPIYEPYADELEDSLGHVKGEGQLPHKCEMVLKDPTTKPHVVSPYNLGGEGQIQALEDALEELKKLAAFEVGEFTWKCGVFTVPQKLSPIRNAQGKPDGRIFCQKTTKCPNFICDVRVLKKHSDVCFLSEFRQNFVRTRLTHADINSRQYN